MELLLWEPQSREDTIHRSSMDVCPVLHHVSCRQPAAGINPYLPDRMIYRYPGCPSFIHVRYVPPTSSKQDTCPATSAGPMARVHPRTRMTESGPL